MQFAPGYKTNCWKCAAPYDVTLQRCPVCHFANANELPSMAWCEQRKVDAAEKRPFGPIAFTPGKTVSQEKP